MDKPSPKKIDKVQKIIPQFEKLCLNYIRPILFGELPLKSFDPILNGATVTFIDTGYKSFGITNYHVFEKYLELKKENKSFKCQIDNLIIDLESRIIDYEADTAVDIVTFSINTNEFEQINAKPLYHKSWPVKYKKDKETEPVFILGFLGHLREIKSLEHIIASYGSLMVTIESINDKRINIVFNRENWITSFRTSKPVDISKIRGFSGAGLFRMNNLIPELLGIVTDHGEDFDILFCSRSDLILDNG